jgi:hypothetical protein
VTCLRSHMSGTEGCPYKPRVAPTDSQQEMGTSDIQMHGNEYGCNPDEQREESSQNLHKVFQNLKQRTQSCRA